MEAARKVIRQHLIDPEVCIRCNTCEETCPANAITHDARNYVVNAAKCNSCLACIAPCPTGAIDRWRSVVREDPYSVEQQLQWDALPDEEAFPLDEPVELVSTSAPPTTASGSRVAPRSASPPHTNLYTPRSPALAAVVSNYRVTEPDAETDTHHIVLDFGGSSFPVLEGQSIGVQPPGRDERGRSHHARQYSIASPRDGERPGRNNVSLTVKRVTVDHYGKPIPGRCSNYLCDLRRGDVVRVTGPFGDTFLMPNHSPSHLLMICTGTGSAPMRAMTERRRRSFAQETPGKLMLFFGARTQQELPYFGPLMNLPKEFLDVNLALSRMPGQPRRYVQDRIRERATAVAELLRDDDTFVYVCGRRDMERGVVEALRDVATAHGLAWEPLSERLRAEGRLHLETY